MTPLQWFLLCVLFTLYLLFGGSVFMYFEQYREIEKKEEISVLRKDIKEILLLLDRDFYHNDTTREMIHALTSAKLGVIHRISSVCDVGDLLPENDIDIDSSTTTSSTPSPTNSEEQDKLHWNFYNSVFFAFTVITTIGYGHLSPKTKWSKCFMMLYALIGIPINSILLSGLGDYFSSRLVKVHKKSKDNPENKCTLFFEIMLYLVPGVLVFIIVPGVIFSWIEQWTFLDSVYYAFVSLTTIGFGDLVAGMGNGHTVWMWIYKAFIIIWITFGLGYLIMILGFITKGMTHKKVRVVIEKRLNTILFTKEKLSRDIDYMRRVVNELYLMKVKPVYDDDYSEPDEDFKAKALRTQSQPNININTFTRRHSSFPQLTPAGGLETQLETGPHQNGGVHFSIGEPKQISHHKIPRRSSDSDLSHIDRDKTFESAIRHQVTVDELLISVVNALSGNVMHEVMDAVEELNELEEEALLEEDALDGGSRHPERRKNSLIGQQGHGQGHVVPHTGIHHGPRSLHGSRSSLHNSHTSLHQDKFDTDDHAHDHVPAWDLGALSESDEEVLIGEDDEMDNLRQVVIHGGGGEQGIKPSSSSIMDKVSGAIRKISSGSRTPPEGPSRKVSKNESFRRKISRNESFEKRITSHQHHPPPVRPYLNPLAHNHNHSHDRKLSQQRKISEESRISNLSSKSRLTEGNHQPPGPNGYGSNASSRKISPNPLFHYDEDGNHHRSKMSLESTSLAEFLQALDNVHSKLNSKTSVASFGGESSIYSDNEEPFPSRLPIVRRSARRRDSEMGLTGPHATRRRKNGIVHPGFSYVNNSFVDDKENEKRNHDGTDKH